MYDGTSLDNRHKIARPYWARPGFALFAKRADDNAGGSGGDDDDEDDDDEDDEDDDDEDDDLAELSEDELRAELKKTRQSLSAASGSSKAKRDKIKRLNRELEEARKPKPKAKTDDDDEKLDADAIKAAAKAEARAESDTRIKKTTVRAELKAAGIPADQATRLIGLVDLESLDVDDDGEVEGLDEAIADLKEAWPQIFNVKPIKRQRQSVAGTKSDEAPKGKLTPSQIQAARATGRRTA